MVNVKKESQTSRRQRNTPTPFSKLRQRKGKEAANTLTKKKEKAPKLAKSKKPEGCFADETENVPHSWATQRNINYQHVSKVYKRFWTNCEDAYVLKVGKKREIDISQLVEASATFNIRSKQDNIV